jgi:precorrin-8X/cobalt-precorrin-8 methylmutase
MSPTDFGILIIGHGTPASDGQAEFLKLLPLVRQSLEHAAEGVPLEAGFLEFASPTISEAVAALAAAGVRRIAAVPVFLAAAGHVSSDIPPALSEAARKHPGLRIDLKPHVGAHEKIAALSSLRYRQALEGRPEVADPETLLLLVAHGSPEAEAFAEWEKFAEKRGQFTPGIRVMPCFAMLGRPQIADLLPDVPARSFRRIVVQPHFLLHSRLYDSLRERIEPLRKVHPHPEWIVTEPLGIHPLLAEAVCDLALPAP